MASSTSRPRLGSDRCGQRSGPRLRRRSRSRGRRATEARGVEERIVRAGGLRIECGVRSSRCGFLFRKRPCEAREHGVASAARGRALANDAAEGVAEENGGSWCGESGEQFAPEPVVVKFENGDGVSPRTEASTPRWECARSPQLRVVELGAAAEAGGVARWSTEQRGRGKLLSRASERIERRGCRAGRETARGNLQEVSGSRRGQGVRRWRRVRFYS